MPGWTVFVDNDMVRDGFDLTSIATENVDVRTSERLSASAVFLVILTYVGGKTLDKVTDGAVSNTLDTLLNFVRSRQHLLKAEFHTHTLDPRVKLVGAVIESGDRAEFRRALAAMKFVEPKTQWVLERTEEYIQEIYFCWDSDEEEWVFSFYMTEGGDVVDSVEAPALIDSEDTE